MQGLMHVKWLAFLQELPQDCFSHGISCALFVHSVLALHWHPPHCHCCCKIYLRKPSLLQSQIGHCPSLLNRCLNGDVCISILHPPVDDPQSGELPSERWNPTQNVRTILLSVISLLNEPNTFSPANVDASVMFRKWRDSKGKDKEYAEIIRKQVLATKAEAEKDGVKVPTTLAEYCIQTKVPSHDSSSDLLYDDLYDDDIEEEEEDEDGECGGGAEEGDCYEDDDDSGNEES
ncbi:UNVERIFIED_CONTAM: hypothetical protein FKN15_063037 [Acipenser sinensis]